MKKIETMEQLTSDPVFQNYLNAEIKHKIDGRELVTLPAGMKYKRSPYDRLKETNRLNAAYMVSEFLLINKKASNRPFEIRNYITTIVIAAIKQTLEFYEKQDSKTLKTNQS